MDVSGNEGIEDSSNANEIFLEARDRFLASLTPDQRNLFSHCSSADQLIDDIESFTATHKQKWRFDVSLKRVKKFSDCLSPYFETLGILVQSHPEIAALCWGAVRLILQLASNFVSFFEKLARTLGHIAEQLPQYETIGAIVKMDLCPHNRRRQTERSKHCKECLPLSELKDSKRLRSSLRNVYVDLLRFLESVARVFVKKDGQRKRTSIVLSQLLWKPFDTHFQTFIEQLEFHNKLIMDDLALMSVKAAKEARVYALEDRARAEEEIANARGEGSYAVEERLNLVEIEVKMAEKSLQVAEEKLQMAEEGVRAAEKQKLGVKGRQVSEDIHVISDDVKSQHDKEQTEKSYQLTLQWLSPPTFHKELERARELRDEGTADWMFGDSLFRKWMHCQPLVDLTALSSQNKQVLWILGNPGCGKTVLASATVDELITQAQKKSHGRPLIANFFFRFGEQALDNTGAAYRALLAQILAFSGLDKDVLDKFAFIRNELRSGQTTATDTELLSLLQICTEGMNDCFWVLDGIDECSDHDTLIDSIYGITKRSSVKVILFSRPHIPYMCPNAEVAEELNIGKATSNDIHLFLSRRLLMLSEDGLLPPIEDSSKLLDHLVTGADGMFLWARLMMEYLRSRALTSSQRLKVIMDVTLPERLEAMYDRIMNLIGQGLQPDRDLARSIIWWLIFSRRPLTSRELQEALRVIQDRRDPEDDYKNFEDIVILACACLVEEQTIPDPRTDTLVPAFGFIHLSAREYLLRIETFSRIGTSARGNDLSTFYISEADAHLELSRICLRYLTFYMPAHPVDGRLGSAVNSSQFNELFPFLHYAALHWITHLRRLAAHDLHLHKHHSVISAERLDAFTETLSRFLSEQNVLKGWIHACYFFGSIPPFELLQEWHVWATRVRSDLPDSKVDLGLQLEDVLELTRYLQKLDISWGSKLVHSPACIWDEITAFTPSRLLAQTNDFRVDSLGVNPPAGVDLGKKYLCKISETDSAGIWVMILSIWPSRNYGKSTRIWHEMPRKKLIKISSCWIAKYEIWSTTRPPICLFSTQIHLPREEILYHLQQSLFFGLEDDLSRPSKQRYGSEDSVNRWRLQFPIAIARSGYQFMILRTIYYMDRPCLDSGLESLRLPLESIGDTDSGCDEAQTRENRLPGKDNDTYLYWLSISPSGSFISFIESDRPKPIRLVVFQLDLTSGRTTPVVVARRQEPYGIFERVRNIQAVFHPLLPLLAFTMGQTVSVWDFNMDTTEVLPFVTGDYPRHIEFSGCGRYVVVTESPSQRPKLILIPDQLRSGLSEQANGLPEHRFMPRTEASSDMLLLPSCGGGQLETGMIMSRLPLVNPNGSVSSISSSGNIAVRKWHQGRARSWLPREEILELVKLPDWVGMQGVTATVGSPYGREQQVRIVLNKTPQTSYTLLDDTPDRLPMVIHRDKRSLRLMTEAGSSNQRQSIEHAASLIEDDMTDDEGDEDHIENWLRDENVIHEEIDEFL